MFIWIVLAIVLLVITAGGYAGHRRYKAKGGGAGDNPKSHNRGHAASQKNHRGRGSGH